MSFLLTTYDGKEKIWSGAKRSSIYSSDTSVGKIMFSTMKNWASNVCQINDIDGVTVTSGQAITWAIRIAQHLKQKGLTCDDVIGIVAKTTNYVMPLAIACLMNTTPFHSVNPTLANETIKHLLTITKPSLIFCDGQDYEKVHAVTREWNPEIFTLTDPREGVPHIESLLDPTKTEMFYQPEPLKSGGDQTVAILCSSGTTGLPKAVCISNSILIQEHMLVTSDSVLYTLSSLDWITGLWAFVFSTVFGCTRIITTKPFSPEYFVQLLKKYKINYALVAPMHISAMITYPDATPEIFSSIKKLSYGGGMLSVTTLNRAQELCKNAMINSGYGITEVGAITVNIGINNNNAAGKLLPGVKIKIVDEDGKNLGHNQVGEIYIQSGHAWNGYYGNPIETLRMRDFNNWFHSGDMGYFDDQNSLYIVDRKREILKFQGFQFWPAEIEAAIIELPQIQEVCVVGIYDELRGDAAGALVVKRKGSEITAKQIIDHVAKRLTGIQKQINAGVRFTDKLPVNSNGKTMRTAVRDLFVSLSENGQ